MPALALMKLTRKLERVSDPHAVLDALHGIIAPSIRVYAAWRVPVFRTEIAAYTVDNNVFPHRSVPPAYWPEFWPLAQQHSSSPIAQLAAVRRHPVTITEALHILKLTGPELWLVDLFHKHHMRDGCYCPVGRWMIGYWSPKVLQLSAEERTRLFVMAIYVAFRLDELVDGKKIDGNIPTLTARELATLRLLSRGHRAKAIAAQLELSEDTVRDHLKSATAKLGAKFPMHAACQALRLHLIA